MQVRAFVRYIPFRNTVRLSNCLQKFSKENKVALAKKKLKVENVCKLFQQILVRLAQDYK